MSTGEKTRIEGMSPEMPLIAQVMQVMLNDAHGVSTTLIDSLMSQVADYRATLDAVRAGVSDLLDGRYAPSAAAIEGALWPSAAYVDIFRKEDAC